MAHSSQPIVVGRIGGPYGVRGWLRVFSLTEPKDNILTYRPWQLHLRGRWQTVDIMAGRQHGSELVIQIAHCVDREQAKEYTGAEIAIDRSQLQPLKPGEYYWQDLIGLTVMTTEDVVLGVIDHLLPTGSNDVLVVKGERQRLLPYLPGQVVVDIDLEQKIMRVDWDPEF